MAPLKTNMDMVNRVRNRLESEGGLNVATMSTIKINLERKRTKLEKRKVIFNLFMSKKKRELDETIDALTYLLEKGNIQD